jgi:uracil phosphoribosyltransferase
MAEAAEAAATTTKTTTTINGNGNGASPSSSHHHHGFGENVHISNHPVLLHKITIMRSSTTEPSTFRAALREVTYHLGYEATSRLTTTSVKISVPHGKHQHIDAVGFKLRERIALIPKIRSGLGMVDSMLELLPNAAIHHIGMYKVLGQHPVQYFNRLPRQCEADVAYVLDPVISTSSTIDSLVSILKKVCIYIYSHIHAHELMSLSCIAFFLSEFHSCFFPFFIIIVLTCVIVIYKLITVGRQRD